MGLFGEVLGGLFGSGTTKQTQNTTQRPWVAPGMQENLNHLAGKNNAFLASDASQYVAPISHLQNRAFYQAEGLGAGVPTMTRAADMAFQHGNAGQSSQALHVSDQNSVLDNGGLQKYLDPQLQMYIDSAMADYDDQAGRTKAALMAEGARAGAFGGSRFGVAQGEFEGQNNRGRSALFTDLMRGGFDRAANLAMGEADRFNRTNLANAQFGNDASRFNASMEEQMRQRAVNAALGLGQIGQGIGADQRANIGLTADLGNTQRQIMSEYSNALPTQLQIAANVLGAIPPQSYIGYDGTGMSKEGPTTGSAIGQGIGQIASYIAMSDRRTKTDVERIGNHGPLGIYSFRYHWDEPGRKRTGVMADEVAEFAPQALAQRVNGYQTVDYSKLGLAHLVEA